MFKLVRYPTNLFALMALCFIGFSSLLLLISGVVFYGTYSEIAYREIRETKQELLGETSRKLSNYVAGIQETSRFLVINSVMHQYLSSPPSGTFDYVIKSRELHEELQKMMTMKAGLHSIEIYTDWIVGYPPYSFAFMHPLEEADRQGWLSRSERSDGFWLGAHVNERMSPSAELVSYVQRIIGERGQTLGFIKINIPAEKLFETLSGGQSGSGHSAYYAVFDSGGHFIASALPPDMAASRSMADLEREIAATRYSIIYSDANPESWTLMQVLSKDVLQQSGKEIRNLIVALLSALIILSVPLAFWVSKRLTAPIYSIVEGMRKVEKGDFNVRLQGSAIQEYRYLTMHFNRMIQRVKALIHRLNQEHRDRREAEAQLLHAQIKPHFLYNTLDLIHWRALDYNAQEISQMVKQLSKLFRIGLSNDKYYVTVRDELAHARCYMAIQAYRQNFSIDYREFADSDLLDCIIPKIILQPFLENAVIHGFQNRSEDAVVQVRFESRETPGEKRLIVTIADNGQGVPRDFDPQRAGGIGIRNVLDRIQLYCGPQYGVRVTPGASGGTLVTLQLPFIRDPEEMEQLTRSLSYEYDTFGG